MKLRREAVPLCCVPVGYFVAIRVSGRSFKGRSFELIFQRLANCEYRFEDRCFKSIPLELLFGLVSDFSWP